MRNKPSDLIYCGVDKKKIASSNPTINSENLKHFYTWIYERYKVHLKKDILHEKPLWTNDEIINKYRFTNVRREHDRESRWLIENISKNIGVSYENKILNTILFRLINKSATIKIIGLLDFYNLNLSKEKEKLEIFKRKDPKYVYFSNAFYTSGPKSSANKIFGKENNVLNMIKLVKMYKEERLIEKIKQSKNQKEVFSNILNCRGIGRFLAYQIYVDLTYIREFPYSENEFVVAGPGCQRGLKNIFKSTDGLSNEELIFWLRDNQIVLFKKFGYEPEKLFSDLEKEDRVLNVMSIQNCLCEISKYIRAVNKEGRPRIKYRINPSSQS